MILGIDPGPEQSAFCLWDGEIVRFSGMESNFSISDNLLKLSEGAVVACEHLQCFGMAVGTTTFETAYWVGDFRSTCRAAGTRFVRAFRSEVKMHHCKSMRAKDANIRQALIDRFGPPGTKKQPGVIYALKNDHLRSAFAIAVMMFDREAAA